MKRIDTINDVLNFNFYKNQLTIKKTNEDLYNNNCKFDFKGEPYAILENGCFCDIQKTTIEIYDLGFNLLTRIEKRGVIGANKIYNSNYFSVRWEDENENEFSSIYKGTEEIKRYDFFFGRFLGTDYRMVYNGYNITNISVFKDIIKNDFLWSYTLPEGFKIFGQVQVIDNLLILYAVDNNFDHSKTIALDINSGNMKWELDNTIFCQVDTEKKLLLGYAIRRYEVIDPFLGKKIVQKSMMDYYEKGLSPVSPNNTIANGKLWFVSGRGENAKFGRINIETSEVDFIQDFPLQNDWQFSKPVFHNGKLYLLDSNNTLHIFEEEK